MIDTENASLLMARRRAGTSKPPGYDTHCQEWCQNPRISYQALLAVCTAMNWTAIKCLGINNPNSFRAAICFFPPHSGLELAGLNLHNTLRNGKVWSLHSFITFLFYSLSLFSRGFNCNCFTYCILHHPVNYSDVLLCQICNFSGSWRAHE